MRKVFVFLAILGCIFWMGGNALATTMTYDYTKTENGSGTTIYSNGNIPNDIHWVYMYFPDSTTGTYTGGSFEYDNYVSGGIQSFTITMDGNKDQTNSSNYIDVFLSFVSNHSDYTEISKFNPADSYDNNDFTFTADILNGTASFTQVLNPTSNNLGALTGGVNKNSFVGKDEFWVGYACHFNLKDTKVDVGVTTSVPEPMSLFFLGAGLLGLVALKRKVKK